MTSPQDQDTATPSGAQPNESIQTKEQQGRATEQPHSPMNGEPKPSNTKAEPQNGARADAPQSGDKAAPQNTANTAQNGSKASGEVSFSEEIEGELRRLKLLVEEREDLLKRIQADFENSLKRTGREIERAARSAEMNTVKRLLPLLDTIEAGMRSETSGSDAHRTLTMVHDELMRTLGSLGVTKIESEGGAFDADLHEALMTKPGADGVVLEVVQQGYRYGESVLRHAKVVIGNGQPTGETK